MHILQRMVSGIDEFVSLRLAERPESNASAPFVAWVAARKRFDLCSNLRVRMEPGDPVPLHDIKGLSAGTSVLVYSGTDRATAEHTSEDRPIIMPTRGAPRRDCELQTSESTAGSRRFPMIRRSWKKSRTLKPARLRRHLHFDWPQSSRTTTFSTRTSSSVGYRTACLSW